MLIIDGTEGITEQDSTLLGIVRDSGKSIIVAINKCDKLEKTDKERIKSELLRKFNFIDYAVYHYISAKNEIGIKYLIRKIIP